MDERKESRRGVAGGAAVILLALLGSVAAPGGLAAQQQRRNPPPPANPDREYTTVARDNLSRVGASAGEIEAVLRKDPGLMVEVKRWVALRASNLGQVLADKDLTDQAVYDRLQSDAELRAAATALLQRYGYLTPTPNPNSEVARQRELVLKERGIQLARLEEQQRMNPPSSAPAGQPQQANCDPRSATNCLPGAVPAQSGAPAGLGPRYGPPEPVPAPGPFEQPLPAPQQQVPWPSGRAAAVETASSMGATTVPASSTAGLNSSGSLITSLPGSTLTEPAGGALEGSGGGEGFGAGVNASGSAGENLADRGRENPGNFPPEFSSLPPGQAAWQPGRAPGRFATSRLVARANPFADIPSLYDMYLQAAPRPAKPERFGMEVFENTGAMTQMLPMDLPAGPNYVVGPGDGLTISLWGSVSQRLFRVVDRTGRVSLPEVGPVLVSGQSLGDVQQAVQRILGTQFRDVSADVSLTRLRTVRVYVVGDIAHPGAYDVSSLSTPLNALFTAGGPTATGSLRVVKHYRGNQLVQTVDLYDLLLHGVRGEIVRLEDGDTVLVPPLGPEVTVEGMVRRPAVYELDGEKNLGEVLELAGGILPAAALKHIEVDRLVAHQKRTMISVALPEEDGPDGAEKQLAAFAIQDGDIVRVFPVAPYTQDAVYLEGHVLRPGKYAYHPGMKLTDLISSYKDLLPQPATNYAEIIRLEPPDYRPRVDDFNLAEALAAPAAAPKLEPLDTVRIFGRYDFEDPPTVWVGGEVRRPGLYRTDGQIRLRDAIGLAGGLAADADLNSAQVYELETNGALRVASVNLREAMAGSPISNIVLGAKDLVVIHRSLARSDPPTVHLEGDVAHPGQYPLGADMRVADLIRLGGGLRRSADPTAADLTRFVVGNSKPLAGEHQEIELAKALGGDTNENIPLRNGDVLTIRQVPGWNDIGASVVLHGEVRHPGAYGIRPGERLSSVLERAGGFLPTAYPRGIVFEREDVRKMQRESRQRLVQQLRQQAASFKASSQATAGEQAQLQQAAFQQSQEAIHALEQAPDTGRMVIRMPENLKRFERSPDDVVLRAGDRIVIPKRPSFVLVTGQVYNANAITFTPRRNTGWYLAQAGGATPQANKKDIFIVRADGAVVSGRASGWWLHGGVLSTEIEPGDTIIVPQKAVGGSVAWKNLLAIAQLAQGFSIAALAAGL